MSLGEYFSLRLNLSIASLTLLVFPLPYPMELSGSDRERPKSQILTWQFSLTRMFDGLISRWTMLAECRNFIACRLL